MVISRGNPGRHSGKNRLQFLEPHTKSPRTEPECPLEETSEWLRLAMTRPCVVIILCYLSVQSVRIEAKQVNVHKTRWKCSSF
jgi:hypothetical protein